MNLQDCLNKVLSEWPNETQTKFTDNQLANFIRKDFAHTVQTIVHKSDSDLIIKASAGAGNWADVPWLSILNPRITKTTQDGIYPVFLFRSDGTGAYLSLGQGITIPKERLGKNRAEERSAWIIDYLRQQIPILHQWDKGKLELHANTPLGKSYGTANIGSHFYERSSLPSNKILESDLIELLSIYRPRETCSKTAGFFGHFQVGSSPTSTLNHFPEGSRAPMDVSLRQSCIWAARRFGCCMGSRRTMTSVFPDFTQP